MDLLSVPSLNFIKASLSDTCDCNLPHTAACINTMLQIKAIEICILTSFDTFEGISLFLRFLATGAVVKTYSHGRSPPLKYVRINIRLIGWDT